MELGRLIALVFQSAAVFFISSRLKSYSLTTVGGIVIFGVPPIIAAEGFTYMDYFLIDPMLIGNFFKSGLITIIAIAVCYDGSAHR